MEIRHLLIDLFFPGSNQTTIVNINRHGQRQDQLGTCHTYHHLTEKDVKCARHARSPKIPTHMHKQPLNCRSRISEESEHEKRPQGWVEREHRKGI